MKKLQALLLAATTAVVGSASLEASSLVIGHLAHVREVNVNLVFPVREPYPSELEKSVAQRVHEGLVASEIHATSSSDLWLSVKIFREPVPVGSAKEAVLILLTLDEDVELKREPRRLENASTYSDWRLLHGDGPELAEALIEEVESLIEEFVGQVEIARIYSAEEQKE